MIQEILGSECILFTIVFTGGYQAIGGTNGPVQDITMFDGFSDDGSMEVIFGGSFSKSAGKNEKVSVSCPVLRFSPNKGEWFALPNSRQVLPFDIHLFLII